MLQWECGFDGAATPAMAKSSEKRGRNSARIMDLEWNKVRSLEWNHSLIMFSMTVFGRENSIL